MKILNDYKQKNIYDNYKISPNNNNYLEILEKENINDFVNNDSIELYKKIIHDNYKISPNNYLEILEKENINDFVNNDSIELYKKTFH